jgi:hypothetical protein
MSGVIFWTAIPSFFPVGAFAVSHWFFIHFTNLHIFVDDFANP